MDISRTGRAVVVATHNYGLIDKYPARMLMCENGKVIPATSLPG
jgi:cell division transport system ATP-binding protein